MGQYDLLKVLPAAPTWVEFEGSAQLPQDFFQTSLLEKHQAEIPVGAEHHWGEVRPLGEGAQDCAPKTSYGQEDNRRLDQSVLGRTWSCGAVRTFSEPRSGSQGELRLPV
jgi:hypothetical protein